MEKPNYRLIAYEFICANPGTTSLAVWHELRAHSRSVRWFGEGTFLATLFGPTPVTTNDVLNQLKRDGVIRFRWGEATGRKWIREPLYWIVDPADESGYD